MYFLHEAAESRVDELVLLHFGEIFEVVGDDEHIKMGVLSSGVFMTLINNLQSGWL